VADCVKHSMTQNLVIPLLTDFLSLLPYTSYSQGRLGCVMLCANQDLNSAVSTRKVPLNKLSDAPEINK
jgi:hypothetical protein